MRGGTALPCLGLGRASCMRRGGPPTSRRLPGAPGGVPSSRPRDDRSPGRRAAPPTELVGEARSARGRGGQGGTSPLCLALSGAAGGGGGIATSYRPGATPRTPWEVADRFGAEGPLVTQRRPSGPTLHTSYIGQQPVCAIRRVRSYSVDFAAPRCELTPVHRLRFSFRCGAATSAPRRCATCTTAAEPAPPAFFACLAWCSWC